MRIKQESVMLQMYHQEKKSGKRNVCERRNGGKFAKLYDRIVHRSFLRMNNATMVRNNE